MRVFTQNGLGSPRELNQLTKAKSKGLLIDFGALEQHVKQNEMSQYGASGRCHDSCCTHYRDLYKNTN